MLPHYETNHTFRREIQLFMTGLAISLVAKGVALFPFGRSVDSYTKLVAMSTSVSGDDGSFGFFVSQGRIGQWALNKALLYLGIIGPGGNTLYVFLTMCCFVAVGVLLCRLWRIQDNMALQVCVVGIFAIHPYHAEIFTFREATLCVGLAQLLGMAGLVIAGRRLSYWIAGSVLLIISLSLYQVAINYSVIALVIFCLLEWSRAKMSRDPISSPADAGISFSRDVASRAAAIVAAVITYFALHKLSMLVVSSAATSVEAPRSAILPLWGINTRLFQIKNTLWHVFAVPEPLMPIATKLLIGAIVVMAIGFLAGRILKTSGISRYVGLVTVGVLLVTAFLSIMGVMMPLKNWCALDRTLSAVSVLVAGFLTIVVVNGGVWAGRFAMVIAFVLLFSFAGVNNVVLSEQLRINSRDMETANRIIMRLEADPAFSAAGKIAVVGSKREYPLRYFTVKKLSDVNASAFGRSWSKAELLREVSGYRFTEPSPEDLGHAEDYCRDARPWPDLTSVTVLNDTAVVCLSNKRARHE